MSTNDYIISYDISDHKRLARLARRIEKLAIRIQRSVFFAPRVTQSQLYVIIDTIISIIDEAHDDVRIYTVADPGYALGAAIDLSDPMILR